MLLDFFPERYKKAIKLLNENVLYEVRLRKNYPVIINYGFKRYYLSDKGVSTFNDKSIVCLDSDIKEIIINITEHSVYAYNDKIKQGYITTPKGVRVGIAGECVFDEDKIITIKNYTSLLVRIPHDIFGCAEHIFNKINVDSNICNTIILSAPFLGKTTILKDLARIINNKYNKSILIIDERGEFSSVSGENIDIIRFSNKSFAFNYGIRTLAPSIVITDELSGDKDFEFAQKASNSGVKIIASCHANDVNDLRQKSYFIKNVFERYVVLGKNSEIGKIYGVYDKDFNMI